MIIERDRDDQWKWWWSILFSQSEKMLSFFFLSISWLVFFEFFRAHYDHHFLFISLKLLCDMLVSCLLWEFMHSWECSVLTINRSSSVSLSRNRFRRRMLKLRWDVWIVAICLSQEDILIFWQSIRRCLKESLNSFHAYLFTFSFEDHRTSNTSAVYNASFVFELRTSIARTQSFLCYEENLNLSSILFVRVWTMTALSDRVILLNFLRTFLMSFLMIRWVIFSMMMILQISVHSVFARVRISFLIAEMSIFELTMIEISDSRFDYLHSMISLTIISTASLSKTSTWAKIQWMWIFRSHCSILRINACSRYWSNSFLRH
jgi:hypothetical protein